MITFERGRSGISHLRQSSYHPMCSMTFINIYVFIQSWEKFALLSPYGDIILISNTWQYHSFSINILNINNICVVNLTVSFNRAKDFHSKRGTVRVLDGCVKIQKQNI